MYIYNYILFLFKNEMLYCFSSVPMVFVPPLPSSVLVDLNIFSTLSILLEYPLHTACLPELFNTEYLISSEHLFWMWKMILFNLF